MDKKLLVSLMMTTPVASAFAIQMGYDSGDLSYQILPLVNSSNWKTDGASDNLNTDENGTLTLTKQFSYIKTNVTLMQAAKPYKFAAKNASNVKYKVGGKDQYKNTLVTNADGSVTIEDIIDDKGNKILATGNDVFYISGSVGMIDIEVVPVDNQLDFSIGVVNITLDFSFSDAVDIFNSKLKGITFVDLNIDDNRQNANDLRENRKKLQEEGLDVIAADIASLEVESASDLAAAYAKLELWKYIPADFSKSTDVVSELIRKYQGEVGLLGTDGKYPAGSYNANVVEENNAWDAIQKNKTNLAELDTKVTALQTLYDNKKDIELDDDEDSLFKSYWEALYDAQIPSQQTAIDNLKKGIDETFETDDEGNLPTTVISTTGFETTINTITAALNTLDEDAAKADLNAYLSFLSDDTVTDNSDPENVKTVVDLADVAYAFNKYYGIINNDYRVDKYKIGVDPAEEFTPDNGNVYDDEAAKANSALAAAYKANEGYAIQEGALEKNDKGEYVLVEAKYTLIEGASEKIDGVRTEMQDRIDDMEEVQVKLGDLYDEQQANLAAANNVIGGYQATYKEYVGFTNTPAYGSIKDEFGDDIDTKREAIATAITNLINETNTLYKAHELDPETSQEFKDKEEAVKTAIKNYNDYLSDTVGQDAVDLLNAYNKAVNDVAVSTASVNDIDGITKKYGDDLNKQFETSFQNIKVALDDYLGTAADKRGEDSQAYENISKSITDVVSSCDKLVTGFKGALNEIASAENNFEAYKEALKDVKLIEKIGDKTFDYKDNTTSYQGTISGYYDDLDGILENKDGLSSQEVYDKVADETKKITNQGLAGTILDDIKDYTYGVTNTNSENVKAMLDGIKVYTDKNGDYAEYPGMPHSAEITVKDPETGEDVVVDVDQKYTDAVADLSKFGTADNTLETVAPKVEKFEDINSTLNEIVNDCKSLNDAINASLDNHAAYERLMGAEGTVTKLDKAISEYAEAANLAKLTVSPALGYYQGLCNDLLDEIGGANKPANSEVEDDIVSKIEKSYQNVTEVADEKGYRDELEIKQTAFENIQKNLRTNQEQFSDLNQTSDRISTLINRVNGFLGGYGEVQDSKDTAADVKAQNDALANLNDRMTASFGRGELIDSDVVKEYEVEYQKILDNVNNLLSEWTDGYHQAVLEANDAWFAGHGIGNGDLDKAYTKATEYVNAYLYQTGSSDYHKDLCENESFQKNHSDLQACFGRIQELNALLKGYVEAITPDTKAPKESDYDTTEAYDKALNAWLESQIVLSDDYYSKSVDVTYNGKTYAVTQQYLVNQAELDADGEDNDGIIPTIDNCLRKIDKDGYETATKYWAANGAVANDAWTVIYNRLIAAGISNESEDDSTSTELDSLGITQFGTQSSMMKSYNSMLAAVGNPVEYPSEGVHDFITGMANLIPNINTLLPSNVVRDADAEVPADKMSLNSYENQQVWDNVNKAWNSRTTDANTSLTNYKSEIVNYTDGADYTSNLQIVNDAISLLNNLKGNRQFTYDDETLSGWLNNTVTNSERENTLLAKYSALINTALENAENAVEKAKEAHQVAVDNNIAYKEFKADVYPAYETDVNNLLTWSWYREDQIGIYKDLKDNLETGDKNAETLSKANTSNTVDDLTEKFNESITVDNIDEAYKKVFDDEVEFASGMMVDLNSAFNNVNDLWSKDGLTDDEKAQLNDWNTTIANLTTYLGSPDYDPENRDGSKATLEENEATISSLIVKLQEIARQGGVVTADTEAATLNTLDATYSEVQTTITNWLDNNVKNITGFGDEQAIPAAKREIESQINTLLGTLASLKTSYESNGDNVIQDADKFAYDMNQLVDEDGSELETIKTNWNLLYNGNPDGTTPEAKAGALKVDRSNYYYAEYSTALNNYWNYVVNAVAQYDSKKAEYEGTFINNYNTSDYNTLKDNIKGCTLPDGKDAAGYIDKLEDAKGKCSITASYPVTAAEVTSAQTTSYKLVREILFNVAEGVQRYVANEAEEKIGEVKTPAKNDKGWDQMFIDYVDIVEDLKTQKSLANNVEVSNVKQYFTGTTINGVKQYAVTTPDNTVKDRNTVEMYNQVIESLEGYLTEITSIYNEAKEDNLITKGDVDGNGNLTVVDVQDLIHIVATHAAGLNDKEKNIADVNSDNDINVGDVTKLINWVADGPVVDGRQKIINRLLRFMPASNSNNSYVVEEVQGENGLRRFALNLANETAFAAGQLDIKLPSYASIAGVHVGERASGLDTYVQDNGDFTTVVITSLDNTLIEGNNGCVLFIDVEGNAEIEVENVIFSDKNGTAYKLNGNSGTGVGIMDAVKDGVKAIYNAAGQKLNKLTKGVNIIRNADGTTTKKIGK